VKLSNANTVAVNASATTLTIGVTDAAIADTAQGTVNMGGIVECIAGAAFAVGIRLMSDGSGRVITLAAAATARTECVGYALTAAIAAGDVVLVNFIPSAWTGNA
jgi:hypothetical protein